MWKTVAVTLAEIMADSGHYSIDSTTVRATSRHRAEKGDTSARSWPLAGRVTSKIHCLADALERPIAFHLTGGEEADCKAYDTDALLADKGDDGNAIRSDLVNREIEAVIPGRSNRREKIEYDRSLYRQRNRIERMFGHLKINRAIATARHWLKFVHAA